MDAALAEDFLQSAYIKAIEHAGEIRDEESTAAWFYRMLRNAITDSYRRQSARTKAQDTLAAEAPTSYEPELEQTVCAYIGDVTQHLKSEYRAIQQVDLDGVSVQESPLRKEPPRTTLPCGSIMRGKTFPTSSHWSAEPVRNTNASIALVDEANCKITRVLRQQH